MYEETLQTVEFKVNEENNSFGVVEMSGSKHGPLILYTGSMVLISLGLRAKHHFIERCTLLKG